MTTLFSDFGAAPIGSIKNDTVSGFKRGYILNTGWLDDNAILIHLGHAASQYPPMAR
jgi:hypothetical protein